MKVATVDSANHKESKHTQKEAGKNGLGSFS